MNRAEIFSQLRTMIDEARTNTDAEAERRLEPWMGAFASRLLQIFVFVSSLNRDLDEAEHARMMRIMNALIQKVQAFRTGKYRHRVPQVSASIKRELFRQLEELVPEEEPAASP